MVSMIIMMLALTVQLKSQTAVDSTAIIRASLNYLEGFYEGDTTKLYACLKPELFKIGYYKNNKTQQYGFDGQMTFAQAVAFAKRVKEKAEYPSQQAPKKVIILDIMNHIACVKVNAWWGSDYLLLSKHKNGYWIDQILWEGPR